MLSHIELQKEQISGNFLLTLEFGEVISLYLIDEYKFCTMNYHGWDRLKDPALLSNNEEIISLTPPNSTLKKPKALIRNVILIDRYCRKLNIGPVWIGIFIDCESSRYFYENSHSIYKFAVENENLIHKNSKAICSYL
jgi:hypothetical protein